MSSLKQPNTREQLAAGNVPTEHNLLLLRAARWLQEEHPEGVYQGNHDNPGYWRLHTDMSLTSKLNCPLLDIVKVFEENRFVPADSSYAGSRQRTPFKMSQDERFLLRNVLNNYLSMPNVADILQEILLMAQYRQALKSERSPDTQTINQLTDEMTSRVDIVRTRINATHPEHPLITQDNVASISSVKGVA